MPSVHCITYCFVRLDPIYSWLQSIFYELPLIDIGKSRMDVLFACDSI